MIECPLASKLFQKFVEVNAGNANTTVADFVGRLVNGINEQALQCKGVVIYAWVQTEERSHASCSASRQRKDLFRKSTDYWTEGIMLKLVL